MAQPKVIVSQLDTGTGPDALVVQSDLFPPGEGRLVQSVYETILPLTGSTTIPFDSTAPLNTEGTEFGSAVLTPTAATSTVRIAFSATIDAGADATTVIVAIFRNTTCVCAVPITIDTAGRPKTVSISHMDSPATTSPVTYSGRIGSTTGNTWYLNSTSTGNNLGGTITSSAGIEEFS